MAETPDGRVVVCDAKINFDDNAEFRQGKVFKLRDRSQEVVIRPYTAFKPHTIFLLF